MMMRVLFLTLFLSFFGYSYLTYAQVVNVESQRIETDTIGWAGSLLGEFTLAKDVEQVFSANLGAHVQFKTPKNLYFLLGDYAFLKGSDKKYIDNTFFHFRYNHTFTPTLRLEAFTQLQNNKITKIDTRFLAGFGPRIKMKTPEKWKMYLGILGMYEYEKELTEQQGIHKDFRNSTYFSFSFKPNKIITLSSTTFYQPLIRDFGDFRILNQEDMSLAITQQLSVVLAWNYVFDSDPVIGVPESNFTFKTGFKYLFNP